MGKIFFADVISEIDIFKETTLTLDLSTVFYKKLAKNLALKSNYSKPTRGSRFGLGRFGSIAKVQSQVRKVRGLIF